MIRLVNSDHCTGCMACVDACSKNAIEVIKKNGILFPQINHDKCVSCTSCLKVCPALNSSKNFEFSETGVFAVWSKDSSIRLNAASGGFCTQMALNTLNRGGYAVITLMRDNRCEYVLTNEKELILKGTNSKYIQANPAGIYKAVRSKLKEGFEVLFVGLPCHVSALYKFLKKEYPQLITIELVCSAAPSSDALVSQLSVTRADELLQFRKKIPGGMWGGEDHNLVLSSNKLPMLLKQTDNSQIYYNVFASCLTARKSCLDCKFARLSRQADFTVGDFHGYRCAESEQGVSLVITRNKKYSDFLQSQITLDLIQSDWIAAINSNPRLYNGWDCLKYHPVIVFRKFFRLSKLWNKLIVNKQPYRSVWLLFKLWTKIVIVLKKKYYLKMSKK